MAIKLTLNPQNDQLVPINALKKWSKEHLEKVQNDNVFKQLFDQAAKRPKTFRDRAGELNNIINELPAPTQEKGGRVWFLKVFLQPFGQKITDEAKEIFEVLSKGWFGNKSSFAELEKAADEYNGRLKTATTNVATSAIALNKLLMDEMGTKVRDFAIAYKQAKQAAQPAQAQPAQAQPAQAQPAPTITAAQILIGLRSLNDKLLGEFYEVIGVNPEINPKPMKMIVQKMLDTAKDPVRGNQFKPIYDNIFSGIMPFDQFRELNKVPARAPPSPAGAPDATGAPRGAAAESIDRELYQSKKLLELGFITENEYLAKLVEIKYILEVAPPTAPPTEGQIAAARSRALAAKNAQEDKVDKGIVTLIGSAQEPGEIAKLGTRATGIQDAMTRFANGIITEALSFKEQQLAKLHVKKQVISEYTESGTLPTKIQLNEFIIAGLILAALAGALAWAASKFGSLFKDAYPSSNSGPSHSSRAGDANKDLGGIANSLGAGIDASGNLVDIQGRQVPSIAKSIAASTAGITRIQNAIKAGVGEISKQDNYPSGTTYMQTVETELKAVLAAQEKVEPAVKALLDNLNKFVAEASLK